MLAHSETDDAAADLTAVECRVAAVDCNQLANDVSSSVLSTPAAFTPRPACDPLITGRRHDSKWRLGGCRGRAHITRWTEFTEELIRVSDNEEARLQIEEHMISSSGARSECKPRDGRCTVLSTISESAASRLCQDRS